MNNGARVSLPAPPPPPTTCSTVGRFLVLSALLLTCGCSRTTQTSLTLVILSPHREEIRDEVETGFADWFRQETRNRSAAAQAAVERWLEEPDNDANRAQVDQTIERWLRHWSERDSADLRQALAEWRRGPARESGQSLRAAIVRWRVQWQDSDAHVEWRDIGGGTSQMVRYLRAGYQQNPSGVGIDLFYGGGTELFHDFKGEGKLDQFPMPPELKALIPQNLRGVEVYDPDGYWHGVTLSSLAILYNRDVLERIGLGQWVPQRWRDLGDERLMGWVIAGDPRMSGSVHMLYEEIVQAYGWDDGIRQLMRMGANARGFARFSDGVIREIVLGRAVAGGALDSYAFSAVTREQQQVHAGITTQQVLGAVLPRGETVLNPDSIGILKGAPHVELARAFVEYLLSPDGGQRLWTLQPNTKPGSPRRYSICRLGIIDKLYDPHEFPPSIRSVSISPFDAGELGTLVHYDNPKAKVRYHALNDLFGAWVIDTHADLHAAWRAVVKSRPAGLGRDDDPLSQQLFAPPCTEQALNAIAAELRAGPRARAEIVSRWLNEARQRYRNLRAAALARRVH